MFHRAHRIAVFGPPPGTFPETHDLHIHGPINRPLRAPVQRLDNIARLSIQATSTPPIPDPASPRTQVKAWYTHPDRIPAR